MFHLLHLTTQKSREWAHKGPRLDKKESTVINMQKADVKMLEKVVEV
jgi:hypothetical protein